MKKKQKAGAAALKKILPDESLRDYLIPVLLTVALFVIGNILSPGFAKVGSVFNFLALACILVFACLGQNLIMLSGKSGIDMSVGSLLSVGALLGGTISGGSNLGLILALVVLGLIGAVTGVVNGFSVQVLGVPAMVVTLSVAAILDGTFMAITKGQPLGSTPPLLTQIGVAKIAGPLRWLLLIAILLVIVIEFVLLRRTRYGKSLYLVGTNDEAASLAGIKTRYVRIFTYILAGVGAAISGLLMLGVIGSSQMQMGEEYTMLSVAAVVIGGTSLAGGKGSYLGSALGAVMITVLNGVLTAIQMSPGGREFVKGIILLVILMIYTRQPKLRQ